MLLISIPCCNIVTEFTTETQILKKYYKSTAMPTEIKKKTLKEIHQELTNKALVKRDNILKKLEMSSPASFYSIINGERKIKDLEKKIIAEEYGYSVDDIDWMEENPAHSNIA